MPGGAIDTVRLWGLIDRMRAGDPAAREGLLRAYYARLETLTRQMLLRYPGVRRWDDTGDVLHPALLRLLRALAEVRPDSTRAFLGLAALQIRRELLTLAQRYASRLGRRVGRAPAAERPASSEHPDKASDQRDLERWSAFHAGVDQLPEEEREVVSLVYYHGLGQEQAAALLGVTDRTVRRRWRRAMTRLHRDVEPGR
jgi:RNA polymerase sigma-70 factor (ECF subfamily)